MKVIQEMCRAQYIWYLRFYCWYVSLEMDFSMHLTSRAL